MKEVVLVLQIVGIVRRNLQPFGNLGWQVRLRREIANLNEHVVSQSIALSFGVSSNEYGRIGGQVEGDVANGSTVSVRNVSRHR